MLKLDYDAVHRFEAGYPNAYWDGWTLCLFKANPAGYSHKRGVFRNGEWGIVTRVDADEQGKWRVRV